MHQTFADRHCATLPGAERVQPFGPDTVVWRVHGHMFAAYTDTGDGISVRTADTSNAMRVDQEGPLSTLPSLTGAGWVLIPWETAPDTLRTRIDESYALVRKDWPNAIPRQSAADGDE